MKAPKLKKAVFKFSMGEKEKVITVYHNLPETFGLSIDNAFASWLHRFSAYTANSFCKYVLSKMPNNICITEKEFNHLNS